MVEVEVGTVSIVAGDRVVVEMGSEVIDDGVADVLETVLAMVRVNLKKKKGCHWIAGAGG